MKILILTAYDDHIQALGEACDISKKEYSEKWGYSFISKKINKIEGTHPSWQKLQILIDHINLNQYDYIVWLDSDIIITNYTFDIKTLFDDNYALTFPEDWCAPPGYNPRAKYFSACAIIINCKTTVALDIIKTANADPYYKNSGCWDQSALMGVLGSNKEFNDKVHRVPRSILNAVDREADFREGMYVWQHGDFCVHLTGLGDHKNRLPKVPYYMENRIC